MQKRLQTVLRKRFCILSELQTGAGSGWQDLAGIYTEQTGVPVTVITAADGTYEQTLKSEMAKSEAPTLFQVMDR